MTSAGPGCSTVLPGDEPPGEPREKAEVLLRVNLPGKAGESGLAGDSGAALVMGGAADPGLAGHSGPALVMGGAPTPFGMDPFLLDRCASWLGDGSPEAGALRLRGLHAHLASGLDAPAALAAAGRVLGFARRWCARHKVRNPEINLGGGMAVEWWRGHASPADAPGQGT
jgi:diaminopimelate decarboxylase